MGKKPPQPQLSKFYQKAIRTSLKKSEASSSPTITTDIIEEKPLKKLEDLLINEEKTEDLYRFPNASSAKKEFEQKINQSFKIKTIRKVPKDYFIEYQKFHFNHQIRYKYYQKKPQGVPSRIRNLMQTFQSFIAFTKNLMRTNFVAINVESFGENYKHNLQKNTQNFKENLSKKFGKYFNDLESFNENFFFLNIYKIYSNKIKDLGFRNVYALLLKNGFEPTRLKENLEVILEKMLTKKNYRDFYERELMKFNFSPKFFDLDFLGNIIFSNIDNENIYINIDCVAFKERLTFSKIMAIFIKFLKFFYVFDFILRNIFTNSGKKLNYHISYQIQYNINKINDKFLKVLETNFVLNDQLFMSITFKECRYILIEDEK